MTTLLAIGGHALAPPGDPVGPSVASACARIAGELADTAAGERLVVTHGNGPQLAWLAEQAERAVGGTLPLDAIAAESEGLLGYPLVNALQNALRDRDVVALMTRTEVAADDPALDAPSKPVGRVFDDEEADCLRARGLAVGRDRHGFRRLVPSPVPLAILELAAIRCLVECGTIVVCAGGGGIPVCRAADGSLTGVEGVVDKDAASALLGVALGADRLLLLTDVPGVYTDWPRRERRLRSIGAEPLSALAFAPGTMGPKVAAAVRFARETERPAWITDLAGLPAALAGEGGTRVMPGDAEAELA